MVEQQVDYPIGIEDFEKIRREGLLYIDKTEFLHSMVRRPGYYLLCRPRRFGKSLFLSTAEAFFRGKRELFEGLAISNYDYDWEPSPVLHLNLVDADPANVTEFKNALDNQFAVWEQEFGVEFISPSLSVRFKNIITAAYQRTGKGVVILVDEYDKPLVSHIDNEAEKDEFRKILKPIYATLKGCDRYIRLAILTGVSRFSRLSIFSDLNNLRDISFSEQYAAICGITEQEMLDNCRAGIQALANKTGVSYDEAVQNLKSNYDGYHFTRNCPDIYNPFSLLSALQESNIYDFWFATGTPTFLLKSILHNGIDLREYLSTETDLTSLSSIDSYTDDPVPMLFQTGYLTLKGYDPETGDYKLGIPNREVGRGLFRGLMPLCTGLDETRSRSFIRDSARMLREGNADGFLTGLQTLLAGVSYELTGTKSEIFFENNLYVIFTMLGFDVQTEYHTSDGRIDVLIRTPKYVYIIEIKRDSSPEAALAQINSKHYEYPFRADNRAIVKIGVNFSTATRNLTGWLIER